MPITNAVLEERIGGVKEDVAGLRSDITGHTQALRAFMDMTENRLTRLETWLRAALGAATLVIMAAGVLVALVR